MFVSFERKKIKNHQRNYLTDYLRNYLTDYLIDYLTNLIQQIEKVLFTTQFHSSLLWSYYLYDTIDKLKGNNLHFKWIPFLIPLRKQNNYGVVFDY